MSDIFLVLKNGKILKTEFSFVSEFDARKFAQESSDIASSAEFAVVKVVACYKRGHGVIWNSANALTSK